MTTSKWPLQKWALQNLMLGLATHLGPNRLVDLLWAPIDQDGHWCETLMVRHTIQSRSIVRPNYRRMR